MLETRIRDLLCAARDSARRRQIMAEFNFHRERSSLIRLGNSAVALSTHEELTRLDIHVQQGRRTGTASLLADITGREQLEAVLNQALENCRAALEKEYDPIFGVVEETVDDTHGYDSALENLSPATKTELCAQVITTLKPRGRYDFSGSWSSGSVELYYITTANDNECYRRLTDSKLMLVLKEQDKKWELSVERTAKRAGEFTAQDIIAEFEELLPIYEKNPGFRTAVGRQRVLFGPGALAALAQLTVWSGLIGRFWEEGRAFTSGKQFGDRLFSEQITIADDPANPQVFGMPFDFSGKRRRRFVLVEKGTFTGLAYDTATAAKYQKQPTGHDLENWDLTLAPGTAPAGIAQARKLAGDALYIPHLHYIHLPDPTKGLFTGSSRFNALRITKGEFTAPLFSSRITDTLPTVLSNVVAVSARTVAQNESATYGRRLPEGLSVPEYMICDAVRISDVADSF